MTSCWGKRNIFWLLWNAYYYRWLVKCNFWHTISLAPSYSLHTSPPLSFDWLPYNLRLFLHTCIYHSITSLYSRRWWECEWIVFAGNCSVARMLPIEIELVPEWTGLCLGVKCKLSNTLVFDTYAIIDVTVSTLAAESKESKVTVARTCENQNKPTRRQT